VILGDVAGAKIVIPGGSGYLGTALTERLVARGDEVVILTRGATRRGDGWRAVTWDARTPAGAWTEELEGARAVVHLSGRRVDTRATRRNVDELISSRVEMGSSASLALTGRRCVPRRLLGEGFEFAQPDFEPGARQALERIGAL
jgi:NAD dependent epimerase/dehydratase family enzyme